MESLVTGTCIWVTYSFLTIVSPQYPDPRDCGTAPGGPVWAKATDTLGVKEQVVGYVKGRVRERVEDARERAQERLEDARGRAQERLESFQERPGVRALSRLR
jgi:hypothetical protein